MSTTLPKQDDGELAIWKAAAILPLRASWEQVEFILQARDVKIHERSKDAWMAMFNKFRERVEEIRIKSRTSSPPEDNSPVLGSAKLSISAGPPSTPPEDPEIMPSSLMTLVEKSEWYPDGMARVWCKQSEEYDEDCMLDVIAEKLACPIDGKGRAVLTFAPNCGGRTLRRKFKITADGDVDIMFRNDPWKEEARRTKQRTFDGAELDSDSDHQDMDNREPQRRTDMDDEIESAQKIAAEAIGASLSKYDLLNLSPDQQLDFGSMFGRFSLSAARAIKAEVIPTLAEPLHDRGRRSQPVSPTRRTYTRNVP